MRGDTFRAKLTLIDKDGHLYIPVEGDIALFTVKRNVMDKKVVLQKELVDSVIHLEPSDTENLEFGSYVYDVQVIIPDVGKDTVIKPNIFELLPEVTD